MIGDFFLTLLIVAVVVGWILVVFALSDDWEFFAIILFVLGLAVGFTYLRHVAHDHPARTVVRVEVPAAGR